MRRSLPLAVLLAAATFLAFAPVLGNGFLGMDDGTYLTANAVVSRGLSLEGAAWAFRATEAANWHPLTWLSHMLDVSLFGLAPAAHHLVSLALHAAAALLLFFFLLGATGARWPAAFAAGLFALHPLRVESVAWAAERKDVLAALFWMLGLLAWLRWARRPSAARYAAVAAAFAAALLSKPSAITFPCALLLLDFWPLGRWRRGTLSAARLALEKAPLLLLSAGSGAATFLAQRLGGAVVPLEELPLTGRAATALWAYAAYLGKTVWPAGLSVYYARPVEGLPAWKAAAAALALAALTVAALRAARARPWLASGWLWYLGTLVPMIGLVQVGHQMMADRYTYLPSVGLAVILAWGGRDLAARLRLGRPAAAAAAAALACLAALVPVTFLRAGDWRDDLTLFSSAVRLDPGNWLAWGNLGSALEKAGRDDEALDAVRLTLFSAQVRRRPENPSAWGNLGAALDELGGRELALQAFQRAVELRPGDAMARFNLGTSLRKHGRLEEAALSYRWAALIYPPFEDAWYNLGVVRYEMGQFGEAVEAYEKALALRPDNLEAAGNLAASLQRLGRNREAAAAYRELLKRKPDDSLLLHNLGVVSARLGSHREAVVAFRQALAVRPGQTESRHALGVSLLAMGDRRGAEEQYRALAVTDPGRAERLGRLLESEKGGN